MNNKNPDPKTSVIYSEPILANRIEIKKEIEIENEIENENETAHDINNDKIKVLAIYQLILQLMHCIELTLFVSDEKSPPQIAAQLPHNAFMWSKEAWQERVHYGLYWMKVVAQAANATWLGERKMQVDLRQLNYLILSIFLSYIEREREQESFQVLRSVEEYNKLDESLERELIANTEQWNRAKEEKRSFEIYTKTIMALEQKFQRQNLKELITQKVKERYLRRRNEVSEEEAKLAGDIQMKALLKQIDDYNERSESDALIAAYKTDVYHNTIELLRIKTENAEKEFMTREIEAENTRQFLASGIAKMKTNFEYLKAKLQLYRTAVQQFSEGAISDFTELRYNIRSLEHPNKSIMPTDKLSNTNLSN